VGHRSRHCSAMTIHPLEPESDAAVLLFWPWNADADVLGALQGLLDVTPAHTPVRVPDWRAGPRLAEACMHDPRVAVIDPSVPACRSLVDAIERICVLHPGHDVVVVADRCALPPGWWGRMARAAHIDDAVGAATVLVNGPGVTQFPALSPEHVPSALALDGHPESASPSYPRVVSLWPQCVWLRRPALELVGPLDRSLTHPEAVLAEFAARVLSNGLSCTLADDVCALRAAGALGRCPESELARVASRHPWLQEAWNEERALEIGSLRRSVIAVRAACPAPSVTIDARALATGVGGTQTYVGGLVLALARTRKGVVRAVVSKELSPATLQAFHAAGAETITYEQAVEGVPKTDIVHRPQQVFTPDDLRLLELVGERLVISHMDLIAYRNPTYHASATDWRAYRRTTRLALAAADRVLFFSNHARHDAIGEDLVEPHRASIAGVGITAPSPDVAMTRPSQVPADRELLLALGADYAHKNRPFILQLFDEFRVRHGWEGMLILAGSRVAHGSSGEHERRILRAKPELARHVLDLGPVSEPEKEWLLAHAVAHVSASVYEGFGLAPLEAARAGRPCLFAAQTSLREVVDPQAATIVPWNAAGSADAAIGLLSAGSARDRHMSFLTRALERFTWDEVAARLHRFYEEAIASPYRGSSPRVWEELKREELIVELASARDDLQARVAHGQPLVDRRDPLLTRAQRRGLMRVASRRWLRGPLLAPFGLLGVDDRGGEE
jgi:glycosyltransferase involved in cell wall biosynthesis